MVRPLRFLLLVATLGSWTSAAVATAPWGDGAWSRRLEITAKPEKIEGATPSPISHCS